MNSIRFNNLEFRYSNGPKIISGLSKEISSVNGGQIVALMGPSGIGKTTLLKLFLGIEKPTSGTIHIDPGYFRPAYIPQKPVLFEHLTIVENAQYFRHTKSGKGGFDEQMYQQTATILKLDGVLSSNKKVYELSGGEQQKISLLRSLSIRPDLILLDEPLTGLDYEVKKELLVQLRAIVTTNRIDAFYVTHHADEARIISDSILYLGRRKNTDHLADLLEYRVDNYSISPPHVDLLRQFYDQEYVFLKESTVKELDKFKSCFKAFGESIQFAIPRKNIRFNNNAGIPVLSIDYSSQYSFVRIKNSETIVTMIKDLSDSPKGFLEIVPGGYIFDESGYLITKMDEEDHSVKEV